MAHVVEPRIREISLVEGNLNIPLEGRMRGSLAFSDVMMDGDTCDIVISYGDTFEECVATYDEDANELVRGVVTRARHANGDVDTSHVSFVAGVKTVIMTFSTKRMRDFYSSGALRFDIAQLLTDDQRNQLQANIGRLVAEPGTTMVFHQPTAPVGWTKVTTYDNCALRLVSGMPGNGGVQNFSTVFNRMATDNFTLTINEMPYHTHPADTIAEAFDNGHNHGWGNNANTDSRDSGGGGQTFVPAAPGSGLVTQLGYANITAGVIVSNYNVGGGQPHAHGMDLRVKYVDVILCRKD